MLAAALVDRELQEGLQSIWRPSEWRKGVEKWKYQVKPCLHLSYLSSAVN